ncbi:histidine kinase dimerization/phosphoacceptor domain -containing protein [Ponticoccus alexandrii]|uniref:GAF domain-containing protein n=1 Tax=Ponticoccus alexandrii TaxID=1943633 RepID=A0ABX7FB91_9RHOB|nr:histidine kinase dimerization/phosphoacceptor domain -containing protein [Ponticoccus alexandrii]QRF66627.1 GAF domain-containing protein [Ponticoccus alexandrii]
MTDLSETETARLTALRDYEILDSAPEAEFDEVVNLVAQLLDMPVALISLVDGDRQWFKARVGMDSPQTPLGQSICAHAIQSDALFEIPDTLCDVRTAGNPLCCGELSSMRFYAGAVLKSASGHRLGTLCVLDTKPRRLTELQRRTLQVMADQVMRQLDLRRALRNEEILRDEIDHRVKNSLQTVSSLVRLYRARAREEETKEMLDAVARRVAAVAELHSALYQSELRSEIPADTYLGRVVALLRSQAPEAVTLVEDLAPVQIAPDVASALAVVISEFAANSFKHAFAGLHAGRLAFRLDDGPQGLELFCEDNGRGDGVAEAAEAGAGIGKRLMHAAAEQVGGLLTIAAGDTGYRLHLVVPPPSLREGVAA